MYTSALECSKQLLLRNAVNHVSYNIRMNIVPSFLMKSRHTYISLYYEVGNVKNIVFLIKRQWNGAKKVEFKMISLK